MTGVPSYRSIWKVSLPIIFSGLAQNIVNVTDTAFLSRVGLVELGAAGNAGIFYFVLLMIGMGFSIGCQIIIGRRNGEKNYHKIGELFYTSLYFLLPLSLVIFILVQAFSPAIMDYLTVSEAVLKASNDFLFYRTFGIFFAYLNFLFIAFYTGITQTKVLTYATFIQAVCNIILDYLLIFGEGGFPEMGIKGAAIASVLAEIMAFLYFIYYTQRKIKSKDFGLGLNSVLKFKLIQFKAILKVGFPVMLQNFIALSSWLCFFLIIEKIGEKELAASHIIRSIYMVLMIPLFGFSTATATLVSNLIGEGKKEAVTQLVKRLCLLSLSSTALFIPLLLLFPNELISIYSGNPILTSVALPLLKVIAGSMIFFSLAYILFSAVTGSGKTQISLAIEAGSIFIYLLSAYLLGISFQKSLIWVWSTEFIYFSVMGIISLLYLKFGNWRNSVL